tara:strand:- start:8251 stop:8574 length:324 start_codon:yes stop_codon:yes gene_type:complete
MFSITRDSGVSFLRVHFNNGPETIAVCKTDWLPAHGIAETLAHCHEWSFLSPALLTGKAESIVQWLEAVRLERIEQRRNRDISARSRVSRNQFALMNGRKDAVVPCM